MMTNKSICIAAASALLLLSACGGSAEGKARKALEANVPDGDALELREVVSVEENGISYICGMVRYGETGNFSAFNIEGNAAPFVYPSLETASATGPEGCFAGDAFIAEYERTKNQHRWGGSGLVPFG